MKKINIAELLKDCPKGMELDCTMFDNVTLDSVDIDGLYPIKIATKSGYLTSLTECGQNIHNKDAKCVIFPKGKTSWEGFQRPFKDGDILYVRTANQWICIYKESDEKENMCHRYVAATSLILVHDDSALCHRNNIKEIRLATEEEKQKLFDIIKERGYKWNAETKTLEVLVEPKFHKGEWIAINKPCQIISINDNGNYIVQYCDDEKTHELSKNFCESHFHLWTIQDAKDGDMLVCDINKAEIGGDVEKLPNIVSTIFKYRKVITSKDYIHSYCHLYDKRFLGLQCTMYYNYFVYNIHPATKSQHDLLYQKIKEVGYRWNKETKTLEKLAQLKFKVGDKVKRRHTGETHIIDRINSNGYMFKNEGGVGFIFEDEWLYELVPNKFDITTLEPFSEVLVRYDNDNPWMTAHFSHYTAEWEYPYFASGACFKQCIPYEGNEHLRGTTKDCEDFYKTWK